jgi:outer membrane protein TolC
LQVALARLAIAERAVAQSAEAHRIVGRKYEGGLAQVAELLDAQAVETQSALGFSQARWSAIVAAAERQRALGRDPAFLEALDTPDSRPTPSRN